MLPMKTRTITQVYREKRLDRPLALIVTILMAIGTVMVFSAGQNLTRALEWRQFLQYTTLRQIFFFPLAVAVMYAASLIPYRSFSLDTGWKRSIAVWLLGFSLVLLVLVLIPGVGIERNNARRWLPPFEVRRDGVEPHGAAFAPARQPDSRRW